MSWGFHRSRSLSTDPQIRQVEKRLAGETKIDQKGLDHAMRDMKKEEKAHQNAKKAGDRAQHDLDKAISRENKTAGALVNAQRMHESAVVEEQNAEKALTLKRQYQQKLEDELQKRKMNVNEYQHTKDVNDQFRETKLSEVHADAASRAGSHANSVDRGPFPVEKEKERERDRGTGSATSSRSGSGSYPISNDDAASGFASGSGSGPSQEPALPSRDSPVLPPREPPVLPPRDGPEPIMIRDGPPASAPARDTRSGAGPSVSFA